MKPKISKINLASRGERIQNEVNASWRKYGERPYADRHLDFKNAAVLAKSSAHIVSALGATVFLLGLFSHLWHSRSLVDIVVNETHPEELLLLPFLLSIPFLFLFEHLKGKLYRKSFVEFFSRNYSFAIPVIALALLFSAASWISSVEGAGTWATASVTVADSDTTNIIRYRENLEAQRLEPKERRLKELQNRWDASLAETKRTGRDVKDWASHKQLTDLRKEIDREIGLIDRKVAEAGSANRLHVMTKETNSFYTTETVMIIVGFFEVLLLLASFFIERYHKLCSLEATAGVTKPSKKKTSGKKVQRGSTSAIIDPGTAATGVTYFGQNSPDATGQTFESGQNNAAAIGYGTGQKINTTRTNTGNLTGKRQKNRSKNVDRILKAAEAMKAENQRPTRTGIAKRTGLSERTVRRYVKNHNLAI